MRRKRIVMTVLLSFWTSCWIFMKLCVRPWAEIARSVVTDSGLELQRLDSQQRHDLLFTFTPRSFLMLNRSSSQLVQKSICLKATVAVFYFERKLYLWWIKSKLSSRNVFHHWVQNVLSSRVIFRKPKVENIQDYNTVPVVVWEWNIVFDTLREEHNLRVLRGIFWRRREEVKKWTEKLSKEELHNL
jgi:hypothetical protein